MENAMSLALSPSPDPSAVVAKALLRAGGMLDLTQSDLGAIIGLSSASMSRLAKGDARLTGKSFELSMLFLRLFRSLDAITGGDDVASRSWLRGPNTALDNAAPLDRIKSIEGLIDVVGYVDARRAIV
jgi:DNA-binding XRE family transcriptional regulator